MPNRALKQLSLFIGQGVRYIDLDDNELVTTPLSAQMGDALVAHPEDFT